MINDEMFDRFPMDTIHELHNNPQRLGKFSIRTGPMLAASDSWFVTFQCTGGHGGATPHLATDVILLQAQFVLSLQTIVSRNVSPIDAAVIGVGAIESRSFQSVNVMPVKICIGGTARSLTEFVRNTVQTRINELAHSLAASFGCTAEVEYIRIGTPLINHEEQTTRAIKATETIVGAVNVDTNRQSSMGGEDFAFKTTWSCHFPRNKK